MKKRELIHSTKVWKNTYSLSKKSSSEKQKGVGGLLLSCPGGDKSTREESRGKGSEPKHGRGSWKNKKGENEQSPCNEFCFKERTSCQLIFLQHSNLIYILFKTHWWNSLHSSAGHQPTFLSSPLKKKKDSISATHFFSHVSFLPKVIYFIDQSTKHSVSVQMLPLVLCVILSSPIYFCSSLIPVFKWNFTLYHYQHLSSWKVNEY